MEKIRVARSFIAADSLAQIVAGNYELPQPVSCSMFSKLLRTQDNDHYRVNCGDDKYVLRVYEQGDAWGRQEDDYLFEVEWLLFLREQGISVAYPLPQRDGRLLGSLDAPEGKRHYALFTFAPGEPMSIQDEGQLYELGAQMARIHNVSAAFKTTRQRKPLDMDYLFDTPFERIARSWGPRRSANMDILLASAEEAREEVFQLLGETPDSSNGSWGVIGGDFHPVSVHFAAGRPTFFNFDRCGYGWRAYDIATFLSNANLLQEADDLSEAFFGGYYSQRPLLQEEHAAVSPFLTLRRLWRMGLFALDNGLAGYTFLAPA